MGQHVGQGADGGTDGGAVPGLRALILAQTRGEVGVPVLLRTAAPAAGEVDPFGTAAYRLQVDLAAALLAGRAPAHPEPGSTAAQLLDRPLLAINLHRVSPENRPVVRDQLDTAAALGTSFDLDAPPPVPGEVRVLVACYDGFAETAAFVAAQCDRVGLRAVLLPVTSAVHGGRLLSDAELADLAARHEVGWHTAGHVAAAEVDEQTVEAEVRAPFRRIERVTGRAPRIGAWRGGTRFDADLPGNRALAALGLTHLMSNWSLEPLV